MTQHRRVSVVIPTRNRSNLLRRALSSVVIQSRAPAEIIVVDDASSDSTPEVLADFADNVRVIRSDRNIERGAARNLGAENAHGELLAFLDSDDFWRPTKLETQLEVAGGDVTSVTGIDMVADGRVVRSAYIPPADAGERVLVRNPYLGGPSSLLIPRQLFLRTGGFPQRWSVQGSEDWLFFVKLRRLGHPIVIVQEPLVVYGVHATNSTANPDRVAVSMWSAVEYLTHEAGFRDDQLRRLRSETAALIARGFAARGRFREAYAWTLRAVRAGTGGEALRNSFLISVSAIGGGMLRRLGVRRPI